MDTLKCLTLFSVLALTLVACATSTATVEGHPEVGEKAPDFELKALDGGSVRLSSLSSEGRVVLVVLRGWPGYQCPICHRQVSDFIAAQERIEDKAATLVFVYPGPSEGLQAHAEEFQRWKGKEWPKSYYYLLDPDYAFTNAYHLRWDAPNETAFPSTFIIGQNRIIDWVKVSGSHGGRSSADEVLAALAE